MRLIFAPLPSAVYSDWSPYALPIESLSRATSTILSWLGAAAEVIGSPPPKTSVAMSTSKQKPVCLRSTRYPACHIGLAWCHAPAGHGKSGEQPIECARHIVAQREHQLFLQEKEHVHGH